MIKRIVNYVVIALAAFFHFLLRSTWRLQFDKLPADIQKRIDDGKPVVFGHLHQDDITLVAFFIGKKVGVLV